MLCYYTLKDGSTKPIIHASRVLLPAEKNYSQIEKEGLAIVYAMRKFHRFIHGRFFILETDHKPLLSIFGSKKGVPTHTANRLQRWSMILLNYNFKMKHLASSKIAHADGLSRLIPNKTELLEETVIAALKEENELTDILINTVRELPVTLEEIKKAARTDEYINKIKKTSGTKRKEEERINRFSIFKVR